MAKTNKMDFLYLKDFYTDSMTEERDTGGTSWLPEEPGLSPICGYSKI